MRLKFSVNESSIPGFIDISADGSVPLGVAVESTNSG